MNILITGASGVLGRRLLSEPALFSHQATVVSRFPQRHIFPKEVRAISGDLREKTSVREIVKKAGKPDLVIHMAACVRWNLSREEAVRHNTLPTRNLLQCLRDSGSEPGFIFISTAFVDEVAHSKEKKDQDGLWTSDQFNNSYEYSKYLAEEEVRKGGLPYYILRPGIITGDSQSGCIAGFNGMYQLLKVFVSGHLPFVVGKRNAVIDLSPVDQVSQAIMRMVDGRLPEGKTYYACGGKPPVTLEHLNNRAFFCVNQIREASGYEALPQLPVIDPSDYQRFYRPMAERAMSPLQKQYMALLAYFLPYLCLQKARHFQPGQNLMEREAACLSLDESIRFWYRQQALRAAKNPWQKSRGQQREA